MTTRTEPGPGIDALSMADVYTPAYTEQIERARHEASLLFARVAMTHLFAEGPAAYHPDAEPPAGAMARQPFYFRKKLLDYLADRGELIIQGDTCRPTPELADRARMSEEQFLGPGVTGSPTMEVIKYFESVVGGVLRGRDGLVLLEEAYGAEETQRLWHHLMVDAGPKRAPSKLAARALDLRLRSGEPTVVFEGGAGIGATLREALTIEGFRERTAHLASYGFTDVSRSLMQQARRTFTAELPELVDRMRFDRVDLDDLDAYDDVPYLQDEAADLVIYESVLYDVANLHQVLSHSRRILKPGGWLVFTFGSRGRPGQFFPFEFFQSTLHSFYRAELDPPRRVNPGYLTMAEWTASLESAGFGRFRVLPDAADHDKWPYGGIVAERP
ncbi:class I SAM-dependent methyltransferase [Streptomyces xiamenensis]|uniref:class I SAM-dependent methyltransferase n=1 Tax=Streptomyces xiamenensis TaxID=408015 RepID=UPI0034465D4C